MTKHFTKILLSLLCLVSTPLLSQYSAMGFNFQGYAIDGEGISAPNTSVSIKYTLGSSLYSEEHVIQTDAFGVFHAVIGTGTPINGVFTELNFNSSASPLNLKVEVKVGNENYVTIHNGPLHSVPYAKNAENGVPVGTIIAHAGTTVPTGWLLCDGTTIDKNAPKYAALWASIGTNYATDGISLTLPDLNGRYIKGAGDLAVGTYQDENVGAHTAQLPELSHTVNENPHNHNNGGHDKLSTTNGIQTTNGALDNSVAPEPNLTNVQHILPVKTNLTVSAHPAQNINAGSGENRPKTAVAQYLIKY